MPHIIIKMYVHGMAYFILLKEGLFRTIITLSFNVIQSKYTLLVPSKHYHDDLPVICTYCIFNFQFFLEYYQVSQKDEMQNYNPKRFICSTQFPHQNLRKHVFYKCIFNIQFL